MIISSVERRKFDVVLQRGGYDIMCSGSIFVPNNNALIGHLHDGVEWPQLSECFFALKSIASSEYQLHDERQKFN